MISLTGLQGDFINKHTLLPHTRHAVTWVQKVGDKIYPVKSSFSYAWIDRPSIVKSDTIKKYNFSLYFLITV